jgi:hypothetical protein
VAISIEYLPREREAKTGNRLELLLVDPFSVYVNVKHIVAVRPLHQHERFSA